MKDIAKANIIKMPAVLVQSRGLIDFIYYDKLFTLALLLANTNQALAIIRLKCTEDVEYIKYILESRYMKDYIKVRVKGSAQPNLSLKQLYDFKFPVPPIEEQERIVAILDRFDALCNDFTNGLSAEIKARQKQYEYY